MADTEKQQIGNKDKQDLAEDRTDWAKERTLLAKERTFSAWARTGISAMIAGVGIAELLTDIDQPWIARLLGIILIVTGGSIYVIGFFSYRKALEKLADKNIRSTSVWMIALVSLGLMFSAGLALLLIISN